MITLHKHPYRLQARVLLSTVSSACLTLAFAGTGGITSAEAANYTASSEVELASAINQANASGDANSTITLMDNFTINSPLPTATGNITIDTSAYTLETYKNPAISVDANGSITIIGKTSGTGIGGTDSGQLAKTGAGTLTLDGVNGSYASAINVNDGTLWIKGASRITAGNGYGGTFWIKDGAVIVSGAGTQVTMRDGTASIQSTNGAILTIENSAVVNQISGTQIGSGAGQKGILNVDGAGSIYKGSTFATNSGESIINVTNGGQITSTTGNWGGINTISATGKTAITVTGAGSNWMNSGAFNLLNGTMVVSDSGVFSTGSIGIASGKNSEAAVLVSGNKSELITTAAGDMGIGITGTGSLTVANGGKISSQNNSRIIKIATNANGVGTLNIGGQAGQMATNAGTVDTDTIQFGAGKGILSFNHIESDYDFDVALSGKGTINQIGSGKTTLSTDQSGFTGVSNIEAGTLAVNHTLGGSANVFGGTLSVNGKLDGPASVFGGTLAANGIVTGNVDVIGGRLQGIGTVGSTINEKGGVIAPGNSIGTLTIDGDYTGNGGLLEIEAILGDDRSATDRLVITGDTKMGDTDVRVINLNGTGAPTIDGIKIVEVGGKSDGNFTLKGNYQKDNVEYVIAGAYAYGLYKNGTVSQDGDWYLRSTLKEPAPNNANNTPDNGGGTPESGNGTDPGGTSEPGKEPAPRYQPGTPIYEAYAQSLLEANSLPTLQQRVGNRYWGVPANDTGGEVRDIAAVWGRVEGAHSRFEPKSSTSLDSYDIDIWKMQAGLDGQFIENESGKLIGSLTFQYTDVSTEVSSPLFGDGSIDTNGYGFGGTLTWYGNDGFYVDGQAQATWYSSDLFSDTANTGLTGDNNGFGYAFSVETGKRFAAFGNWTLTPQAQLVYSAVDFDSFNGIIDTSRTHVSLDRDNSLQGRIGLSADYQANWIGMNGKVVRTHGYVIANLYQEFLDGTRVMVGGTRLATENERTWGGIGAGGSYEWANGKYRLYGELAVDTSLNSFADNHSLGGTIGFKVSF